MDWGPVLGPVTLLVVLPVTDKVGAIFGSGRVFTNDALYEGVSKFLCCCHLEDKLKRARGSRGGLKTKKDLCKGSAIAKRTSNQCTEPKGVLIAPGYWLMERVLGQPI